jgi:hypothetical protein
MSAIRLRGATSGTTDVVAAAIAGDGVLSLPSGTGTLATAAYVDAAVAAGGKVLQVVRATDATTRTTTSTTFVDASLSVTITPNLTTSIILLIHVVQARPQSATGGMRTQITDTSNSAIAGAENLGADSEAVFIIQTGFGYATPATTSPVTYKVRFRANTGGTAEFTNSSNVAQLFAIEVAA